MKAVVTLILIVVIGAIALPQISSNHESKIQHCKVGLILDHCTVRSGSCEESSQIDNIARLYKRANTRIRKALNFKIKNTKAKLA